VSVVAPYKMPVIDAAIALVWGMKFLRRKLCTSLINN
jgi:hypothetical protein